MSTTRTITVRDEMDWAEFFVNEREPRLRDDGHPEYSATWCCVSSYGAYGHHWSHMGEPFAVFIKGVGVDYLLSKIARQSTKADIAVESVRREILRNRRDGAIDKRTAEDALQAVEEIECDYSDGSVATMLYENAAISKARIEWCDLNCQDYDTSAKMFAKRMWPKFVKEFITVP